jgi:hypothetical protein
MPNASVHQFPTPAQEPIDLDQLTGEIQSHHQRIKSQVHQGLAAAKSLEDVVAVCRTASEEMVDTFFSLFVDLAGVVAGVAESVDDLEGEVFPVKVSPQFADATVSLLQELRATASPDQQQRIDDTIEELSSEEEDEDDDGDGEDDE